MNKGRLCTFRKPYSKFYCLISFKFERLIQIDLSRILPSILSKVSSDTLSSSSSFSPSNCHEKTDAWVINSGKWWGPHFNWNWQICRSGKSIRIGTGLWTSLWEFLCFVRPLHKWSHCGRCCGCIVSLHQLTNPLSLRKVLKMPTVFRILCGHNEKKLDLWSHIQLSRFVTVVGLLSVCSRTTEANISSLHVAMSTNQRQPNLSYTDYRATLHIFPTYTWFTVSQRDSPNLSDHWNESHCWKIPEKLRPLSDSISPPSNVIFATARNCYIGLYIYIYSK